MWIIEVQLHKVDVRGHLHIRASVLGRVIRIVSLMNWKMFVYRSCIKMKNRLHTRVPEGV